MIRMMKKLKTRMAKGEKMKMVLILIMIPPKK